MYNVKCIMYSKLLIYHRLQKGMHEYKNIIIEFEIIFRLSVVFQISKSL